MFGKVQVLAARASVFPKAIPAAATRTVGTGAPTQPDAPALSLLEASAEPSPEFLEIEFPPDEEGASTLIGYTGKLPVCFGKNVTLECYNDWLGEQEYGLRVSYDTERQAAVLREECSATHGTTRFSLLNALATAFAAYGYCAGLGRLTTGPGLQDVSPDGFLASGRGAYPVLAEVGASQTINKLNDRAHLVLGSVPGAQVVVLVKIFDTTCAENGRIVAWCATHDSAGNLVLTDMVEFGRTGPGGTPLVPWAAGTPPPSLIVPAHGAVPAISLPLDNILTTLRFGGDTPVAWRHPPAP